MPVPLLYIILFDRKSDEKTKWKEEEKITHSNNVCKCECVCVCVFLWRNLLLNLDVWQFDVCNESETNDWRARIEAEKKEDIDIENILNSPAFCSSMLWKPANKVHFSCCTTRWFTVITFLPFAIFHTLYTCVCMYVCSYKKKNSFVSWAITLCMKRCG